MAKPERIRLTTAAVILSLPLVLANLALLILKFVRNESVHSVTTLSLLFGGMILLPAYAFVVSALLQDRGIRLGCAAPVAFVTAIALLYGMVTYFELGMDVLSISILD